MIHPGFNDFLFEITKIQVGFLRKKAKDGILFLEKKKMSNLPYLPIRGYVVRGINNFCRILHLNLLILFPSVESL